MKKLILSTLLLGFLATGCQGQLPGRVQPPLWFTNCPPGRIFTVTATTNEDDNVLFVTGAGSVEANSKYLLAHYIRANNGDEETVDAVYTNVTGLTDLEFYDRVGEGGWRLTRLTDGVKLYDAWGSSARPPFGPWDDTDDGIEPAPSVYPSTNIVYTTNYPSHFRFVTNSPSLFPHHP